MESTGIDKRRQRRVKVPISIRVQGLDSAGREFDDLAKAIEVSRRGLSFFTTHNLAVSASVSVTIPGRGQALPSEDPSDFFAEATVFRCVKASDDTFRVALRFRGATFPMLSAERV